MVYIELNSIRAKMAETPDTSVFTAIKQRIEDNQSVGEKPDNKGAVGNRSSLLLKEWVAEGHQLIE